MRRWAIALVAGVISCSDPAEPTPVREVQCGDRVCDARESRWTCPQDCLSGASLDSRVLDGTCSHGLSWRELADAVELSLDLAESVAGLPTAIELTDSFVVATRHAARCLTGNPESSAWRATSFRFGADATYRTSAPLWTLGGGLIEITVHFERDYGVGREGELIAPNMFDPESYLHDARVVSSGSSEATVAYSSPGPLVEMLGLGPTPKNPATVSWLDAQQYAHTFHYRVGRTRTTGDRRTHWAARGVISGEYGIMRSFEFEPFEAERASLGQHARVLSSVALSHAPVATTPVGTVRIEIPDGPMPHVTEVVFREGRRSSIYVGCY